MERIARLRIEKLPEGVYLATSDDVQDLVVRGRTIGETVEIARDVARRLIEAQEQRHGQVELEKSGDAWDYPIVVAV